MFFFSSGYDNWTWNVCKCRAPLNVYCCACACSSRWHLQKTLTLLFQHHPFPESHALLLLRMISASQRMNLCNVKFNMPALRACSRVLMQSHSLPSWLSGFHNKLAIVILSILEEQAVASSSFFSHTHFPISFFLSLSLPLNSGS